jgi:hypothetical protein
MHFLCRPQTLLFLTTLSYFLSFIVSIFYRLYDTVVSVAAGLKTDFYESLLPHAARVVRVMPNTPSLVGKGASAFCLGKNATSEDAARVQLLMSSLGLALEVEEGQMDAVTALSGSGPAVSASDRLPFSATSLPAEPHPIPPTFSRNHSRLSFLLLLTIDVTQIS